MFDIDLAGRVIDRREQAAVLAVVDAAGHAWRWHEIAEVVDDVGSAVAIIEGVWSGFESEGAAELHALVTGAGTRLEHYEALIEAEEAAGAQLVTVLDAGYPTNLRAIYNRPPFLFIRGRLTAHDDGAIAIVGTRQASDEGLSQASELATSLAKQGVTVVSGMALGVDTAAHRAALAASGRTIAVMGSGIRGRYPKQNTDLADEIEANGALISQFWPDSPPRGPNFLIRNVVTSGLALGTVVIEASSTSGAKSQARHALEHGKLLFLVRSLVESESWARDYADNRGAIMIDHVSDIQEMLSSLAKAESAEQLTLG